MGSYGQTLLKTYLSGFLKEEIIEDYRPEWLFGMEIDLLIPTLNLAIEFNGDQHQYHTEFGSPASQKRRDKMKKMIILDRGMKFLTMEAIDLEARMVKKALRKAVDVEFKWKSCRSRASLDKESAKYRDLLLAKYGSPSCVKRSTKRRAKLIAAMNKRNGGSYNPKMIRGESKPASEVRSNTVKQRVVFTEKILQEAKSDAGGWSRKQLGFLGVSWPPKKGWKNDLIGKSMTEKQVNLFISTRKTKSNG